MTIEQLLRCGRIPIKIEPFKWQLYNSALPRHYQFYYAVQGTYKLASN